MPDKQWSHGRSASAAVTIPTKPTDCSSWATDTPADQWSHGRSVSAAVPIPTKATDCAAWDADSLVWIAVRINYPPSATAEAVAVHARRVVESLQALDPELGLVYDEARSSSKESERSVIVALSPTRPAPDLEERLLRILAKGRLVDATVPITGLSVEWGGPLAV